MDEDYTTIDARICEARRLRAEAAGELVAAVLQRAQRALARALGHAQRLRATLAARVHAALHHRRPVHH